MSLYDNSQRKKYIDGDISHSDYYGILVVALGEQTLRDLLLSHGIGSTRFAEALKEDEHLNNISLSWWDALHPTIMSMRRSKENLGKHLLNLQKDPSYNVSFLDTTVTLSDITGSTGWSLSDTVCTLKECARRWAIEVSSPHAT